MCTGSPSAPTPPPAVPEAPRPPEVQGSESAEDQDRRRRAMASGESSGRSTILTGSRGTTESANTANKTLLGQ